MSILELKEAYNDLLDREKKAEAFFDNPSIEQHKKDTWLPKYTEITESLGLLSRRYKEITGEEMTIEEILNGFHKIEGSVECH